MATSKPTIDTVPKRAPNLRPRTSPPTVPTVPVMRKPETTNTRQNPNVVVPLSPSTKKRSTAPLSKPVTTSTSHAKSPKPKKNPTSVITASRDKVHGLKSHKEGVQSPKPPSPKPKTETAITRSSSGIKTSTKVGNTSAPIRGRSPVAATRTVNKIGGTVKPTSKRGPGSVAKTGTKGSLSRVNSAPNLIEDVTDIQREQVAEVPVEEEKGMNMSLNLEKKDEQTELIPVPPLMEEEEEKEWLIDIGGENEGQIETYAENEVKEEEKESIEEVTPETITAEPVPIPTIPEPAVAVSDVPVPDVPAPVVPASVVPVPIVPVPVPAATVLAHGKKEAGTSNAAIEETRTKLIEKRKSKVLALVGAFESVMKEKEKEKDGESQTIGQSSQNICQSGENGESKGKGDDDVEEVEKPE